MNLIYLNLIILILLKNVLSIDNYFRNSIFQILKDKKLEFKSDLHIQYYDSLNSLNLTEDYSFREKNGRIRSVEINNKVGRKGEILYLDNAEEIYQINQDCESRKGNNDLISLYLKQWIPKKNLEINKIKNIMLGPNSLIIYLLDEYNKNKEVIKCDDYNDSNRNNSKKCTIENFDSNQFKIDYYFEDRDQFTMFPFKLSKYEKNNNKWQLINEFKYLNFQVNFDSSKTVVDSNLPIGLKCSRLNPNKYPYISINYDGEFTLDFNVNFNFLNKDGKFNTLNYTNTMRVQDNDYRLNSNDGNHEINNLKIRTFYDGENNVYYDNYLDDNRVCERYQQKSKDDQINWYYIGNLFSTHREFFYAENNIWKNYGYSYIGQYELIENNKSIDTIVFENVFSGFNKRRNSLSNDRNKNDFYSNYLISTHYYPKDKKYWKDNYNRKSIPIKIEMRFFDEESPRKEIGNLTIRFTDFKPSTENIKFEISKCIQDLNLANHSDVTFIYNGTKENINKIKDDHLRIENNFRNRFIFVAPHRIGNVHISTSDEKIYVNFKLFNPIEAKSFFVEENGRSFSNENKLYKNIELEQCSRYCVEMKNCASYSYNKLIKNCNLWIDKNFDYEMKEYGKYNWNKLPLIDDKDSLIGKRQSRYTYGKHVSNDDLIEFTKQFLKRNEIELVFYEDVNKYIVFDLIDLKVEKRNDAVKSI